MKPKQAALAAVEIMEAGDPKWDRARKLRDEVKHAFRRSIEAQVLLGGELMALKTELGFEGSGRRKEKGHRAPFNSAARTWEEWCQAELGLSERTAQRFIACFKLIQDRARKLGEDTAACRLLGTPAYELGEADYKVASQVLNQLIGEDSQADLLREFGMLRRVKVMTGGDTSAFRKSFFDDPTPAMAANFLKAAFAVFHDAAMKIGRHRWREDIEAWLALAPEDSADPKNGMGLMDYFHLIEKTVPEAIADLEDIRARVSRFVDARKESQTAAAKKARRASAKTPTNR